MKIPVIRQLVEQYQVPELSAAEAAILEEQPTAIEVPGADEGEQLTHVMAAIWIRHQIDREGVDFMTAMRQYTQRVRACIS